MTEKAEQLKQNILSLVNQYYDVHHRPTKFEPGKSKIHYAGRVYDQTELVSLVNSALEFWLTLGKYANAFEEKMRLFFKSQAFLMVNSGSSANLLMVSTLCSPELDKLLDKSDPKRLHPGDEVITPAVTFPTTLAPIIQNQLVPVFVDCEIGSYNINASLIENAIGPKTKAIFIPHTVGNPCDMSIIMDLAQKHNLWVLEDGCDALGATFNGQLVGSFGAMSSLSFYPAHHITTGEGGGVSINHPKLRKTALSMRDWGRDCWCEPGMSDTCGKRFGWQLGELPCSYDHKYIYSNIGYNLKATDLQAAIGLAQSEKIEQFITARRRNFKRFLEGLKSLEEYLIFPIIDSRANPSPFGFPITVRDNINRNELIQYLEAAKIETRLVFGGNILRQPGYLHINKRISGELTQSDIIMKQTFFIGVYPGLTNEMIDYVIETFCNFFQKKKSNLLVASQIS